MRHLKRRQTPHAAQPKSEYLKISTVEEGMFQVKNPVEPGLVVEYVKRVHSPDVHAISLTGGEPLFQLEFLASIMKALKGEGYKTYLETNGSMPERMDKIAFLTDYCCCDIKDETAGAAENWRRLVELELKTISILIDNGVSVFAKVVVTSETKPENVEWYASKLSRMDCPLCIQPVTPIRNYRPPSQRQLFSFTEAAAKHLGSDNVAISVQVHKFLGIP